MIIILGGYNRQNLEIVLIYNFKCFGKFREKEGFVNVGEAVIARKSKNENNWARIRKFGSQRI